MNASPGASDASDGDAGSSDASQSGTKASGTQINLPTRRKRRSGIYGLPFDPGLPLFPPPKVFSRLLADAEKVDAHIIFPSISRGARCRGQNRRATRKLLESLSSRARQAGVQSGKSSSESSSKNRLPGCLKRFIVCIKGCNSLTREDEPASLARAPLHGTSVAAMPSTAGASRGSTLAERNLVSLSSGNSKSEMETFGEDHHAIETSTAARDGHRMELRLLNYEQRLNKPIELPDSSSYNGGQLSDFHLTNHSTRYAEVATHQGCPPFSAASSPQLVRGGFRSRRLAHATPTSPFPPMGTGHAGAWQNKDPALSHQDETSDTCLWTTDLETRQTRNGAEWHPHASSSASSQHQNTALLPPPASTTAGERSGSGSSATHTLTSQLLSSQKWGRMCASEMADDSSERPKPVNQAHPQLSEDPFHLTACPRGRWGTASQDDRSGSRNLGCGSRKRQAYTVEGHDVCEEEASSVSPVSSRTQLSYDGGREKPTAASVSGEALEADTISQQAIEEATLMYSCIHGAAVPYLAPLSDTQSEVACDAARRAYGEFTRPSQSAETPQQCGAEPCKCRFSSIVSRYPFHVLCNAKHYLRCLLPTNFLSKQLVHGKGKSSSEDIVTCERNSSWKAAPRYHKGYRKTVCITSNYSSNGGWRQTANCLLRSSLPPPSFKSVLGGKLTQQRGAKGSFQARTVLPCLMEGTRCHRKGHPRRWPLARVMASLPQSAVLINQWRDHVPSSRKAQQRLHFERSLSVGGRPFPLKRVGAYKDIRADGTPLSCLSPTSAAYSLDTLEPHAIMQLMRCALHASSRRLTPSWAGQCVNRRDAGERSTSSASLGVSVSGHGLCGRPANADGSSFSSSWSADLQQPLHFTEKAINNTTEGHSEAPRSGCKSEAEGSTDESVLRARRTEASFQKRQPSRRSPRNKKGRTVESAVMHSAGHSGLRDELNSGTTYGKDDRSRVGRCEYLSEHRHCTLEAADPLKPEQMRRILLAEQLQERPPGQQCQFSVCAGRHVSQEETFDPRRSRLETGMFTLYRMHCFVKFHQHLVLLHIAGSPQRIRTKHELQHGATYLFDELLHFHRKQQCTQQKRQQKPLQSSACDGPKLTSKSECRQRCNICNVVNVDGKRGGSFGQTPLASFTATPVHRRTSAAAAAVAALRRDRALPRSIESPSDNTWGLGTNTCKVEHHRKLNVPPLSECLRDRPEKLHVLSRQRKQRQKIQQLPDLISYEASPSHSMTPENYIPQFTPASTHSASPPASLPTGNVAKFVGLRQAALHERSGGTCTGNVAAPPIFMRHQPQCLNTDGSVGYSPHNRQPVSSGYSAPSDALGDDRPFEAPGVDRRRTRLFRVSRRQNPPYAAMSPRSWLARGSRGAQQVVRVAATDRPYRETTFNAPGNAARLQPAHLLPPHCRFLMSPGHCAHGAQPFTTNISYGLSAESAVGHARPSSSNPTGCSKWQTVTEECSLCSTCHGCRFWGPIIGRRHHVSQTCTRGHVPAHIRKTTHLFAGRFAGADVSLATNSPNQHLVGNSTKHPRCFLLHLVQRTSHSPPQNGGPLSKDSATTAFSHICSGEDQMDALLLPPPEFAKAAEHGSTLRGGLASSAASRSYVHPSHLRSQKSSSMLPRSPNPVQEEAEYADTVLCADSYATGVCLNCHHLEETTAAGNGPPDEALRVEHFFYFMTREDARLLFATIDNDGEVMHKVITKQR
ncbi:hypothetical protein BESB_025330 [Besnoitia besnoiti]|uniref:Uncharacterized protein n=1 Tax=Besnoitia besnoiti TaxID=94643 RepID=A0A2A9M7E0_BESBE|nr:uncharacterized protein BESB_025330 [Besnoitia besnoiti]PFH31567.1 hypothetical protein BESB_025330 [Besnoitia besnoiti]